MAKVKKTNQVSDPGRCQKVSVCGRQDNSVYILIKKKIHEEIIYVFQEIEHFLNNSHGYCVSSEFRLEGLKFLQSKLKSDQESLLKLTKGTRPLYQYLLKFSLCK